jgi:hypothetical protein
VVPISILNFNSIITSGFVVGSSIKYVNDEPINYNNVLIDATRTILSFSLRLHGNDLDIHAIPYYIHID